MSVILILMMCIYDRTELNLYTYYTEMFDSLKTEVLNMEWMYRVIRWGTYDQTPFNLFLRLYQKHTMYLPAQLHAWTALIVIANHMCLNRLLHMPNQCVWLVDKNNRDAWLVPRDVIWYMHGIYIIFIYQSHALIWPMKQPVRAHVAGNHN